MHVEENVPTVEEAKEEEYQDANDVEVNFDGSDDFIEAESDVVFAKSSVVLISQDDRVPASFLLGSLAQD